MIVIYPNLGRSYSMTRYANGLAAELTQRKIPFKFAITRQHDSRIRRMLQKYIYYPLRAFLLRGNEQHIIVSERFAYLTRFLKKDKTLVVCHDLHTLYPEENNGWVQTNLYRYQIRRMLKASQPVAISGHTLNDLHKYFPKSNALNIPVVYDGLEEFWFKNESDAPKEVEGQGLNPYLLAVGTDAWYKNLTFTIDLLASLPERFCLVKVGHISDQNREKLESLGLEERLIHKEHITDDALMALYREAHCLIFPSLSEGFGWPAVEAMACGCPVVTSGLGSVKEVCGEAALYCDTRESYIRAIEQLNDPEQRRHYKELGRNQANRYSWKQTVDALLRLQ